MIPTPKGNSLTSDPIPNKGGDNNRGGKGSKQPVRTEMPSVKEGSGDTHKTSAPFNLNQ